jgi:malate dehydrogenase
MGIASHGDYEIPTEVIYGFPVTCANGEYTLIKGLEIDSFSRERMTLTLNELLEEQAGVKHLLS